MAQKSTTTLQVAAELTGNVGLSSVSSPISWKHEKVLTDGSGANQANMVYSDQRTLGASASESLDLSGALNDALGNQIAFTKIKTLIVTAAAGNTNDVVVGGAAANACATMFGAATDKVRVPPGGMFAISAPDANGFGVTAGTGDLLQIANGGAGAGVTYDIIVIGVE